MREYPVDCGEPFYPILCKASKVMYKKYYNKVSKLDNVFFVGRLAEYRYYNMDEVVERALNTFEYIANTLSNT